jgi:hypothetical protein
MAKLTEAEWLTGTHPTPLLDHLTGVRKALRTRRGRRKLAAFVAEVFRRLFPLLHRPPLTEPVSGLLRALEAHAAGMEVEEDDWKKWDEADLADHSYGFDDNHKLAAADCSDFLTRGDDLDDNNEAKLRTHGLSLPERRRIDVAIQAVNALWGVLNLSGFYEYAFGQIRGHIHAALAAGGTEGSQQLVDQANVIRDVFGNPFRESPKFNKKWRTSAVMAVAGTMHQSRTFDSMPILGDALEDAGCDSTDILSHCRTEAIHVCGCWVVDLTLGKE